MCESNSTEIPEWINDYQPVDKVDKELLDLFCKLYSQSDSSKGQHRRTIQKIYQLMINKNLLKRSSHENYNEALEKNFKWAIGLKIIITYELKEKLRQYCQNSSEEPEITIINHLNNLQNTEYNTKKYKQIENYLATQIDNLLEKLKKDNTANSDYLNILQSYIIRIPRIKSFDKNLITHTHSFKDILVSWINNNLKKRINDLYDPERQPNQIPTISLEKLDSELTYNNFPQTQYNAARNTLENYLTEDPFQLLASTYIDKDNFPNLTYIAYIPVRFQEVLNEVEILGYRPIIDSNNPPINIGVSDSDYLHEQDIEGGYDDGSSLFPIENFLNFLFNIQDIVEAIENGTGELIGEIIKRLEAEERSPYQFTVECTYRVKECQDNEEMLDYNGSKLFVSPDAPSGEINKMAYQLGSSSKSVQESKSSNMDDNLKKELEELGSQWLHFVKKIIE